MPKREATKCNLKVDSNSHFEEFNTQSKREMSTTMVFVRLITTLLRDQKIGKTLCLLCLMRLELLEWMVFLDNSEFIAEKVKSINQKMLIRLCGIESLKDGVMLEEGINEAGAFSAWIALATSYANNSLPMIPFIFTIQCLVFKGFMI